MNLNFRDRLKTYDDLKREDDAERKEELIGVRGKVKVILNENFALIWGPMQEDIGGAADVKFHCLFDTFDLHVSQRKTAADQGVAMSSVVKVGDEVTYNACLMDKHSVVPYLATSVWRGGERAFDIPPLSKSLIQPDKITVYTQVVTSCQPYIDKASREERQLQDHSLKKAELKMKEEEIRYSCWNYISHNTQIYHTTYKHITQHTNIHITQHTNILSSSVRSK